MRFGWAELALALGELKPAGATYEAISEAAGVAVSTVKPVVKDTANAGLVEVGYSPHVGHLVYFTPLGAKKAMLKMDDSAEQWLSVFDDRRFIRFTKREDIFKKLNFDEDCRLDVETIFTRVIDLDGPPDGFIVPHKLIGFSCPALLPRDDAAPIYVDDCPAHPDRKSIGPDEYCLYCEGKKRDELDPGRPRVARIPRTRPSGGDYYAT